MRKRNVALEAFRPWFPLELPISYAGQHQDSLQGDGRTLAISSSGIRFACERNLPVGLILRVAIQWPAKLGDGTRLNLSATGVIRCSALCEVEIAMTRHEFRTRRGEDAKPLIMIDGTARVAAGATSIEFRSCEDGRTGERSTPCAIVTLGVDRSRRS